MDNEIFLGLETIQQFEDKLNQFTSTQKFQRRIQRFPHKSIIKRSSSIAQSQISTAGNSSTKQVSMYEKKPDYIKQRRQCEIFGDEISYTFFSEKIEYLVTQCNDTSDIVMKELQRVSQELRVSLQRIQQFETEKQREDYILGQIQQQIMDSLKAWRNRIQQREIQQKKIDQTLSKFQNQQNSEMFDIFDWIEIDTKFRKLKKRLKFALVEIINDKQNTIIIKNQLSQRNNQITIHDLLYKKPDTRQIIDELTNLLKIIKTKKNDQQILQIRSTNTSPYNSPKSIKIDNWDQNKEQTFRKKRVSVKSRLSNLINSSSWNSIAMGELITTYDRGQQNKQQREELLQKLESLQPMNSEDMLYLINTSVLLNKCSDKRFIQSAINHLDKDIISDIELQIAENILKSHFEIQKQLNQSRLTYLKIKNNKTFQQNRLAKNTLEQADKKISLRNIQIRMCNMLREMREKTQKNQQEDNEKYSIYKQLYKQGNPIANPYVWKFKDVMMNVLKKKKIEQREKHLGLKLEIERPLFPIKSGETLSLKSVIRKTHPSSKLKLTPKESQYFPTPEKVFLDFKLKIRKREFEKDKQNFLQFYTGGPKQPRKFYSPQLSFIEGEQKQSWITPQIEVIAINKIKRALKAYISRKKYQQQKDLKRKQKYEEKEKDPKFFQLLHKMKQKNYSNIDIEELYKNLKQFIVQNIGKQRNIITKQKTDYSQIKIPHSMIQLKLKQRKLFLALKVGNIRWAEYSGFQFDSTDVNCYDTEMYCPLYHAAQLQSQGFCSFLINAGADVNMPCKNNLTPTFAAFSSNNMTLINLFISNGANLDIINNEGKNPLCYVSINILKELNLQYNPIIGQASNKSNQQQQQNQLEQNYCPYVEMKMDPLIDTNDQKKWENDQIHTLKTYYTKKDRDEFYLIKQKSQQKKEQIQSIIDIQEEIE